MEFSKDKFIQIIENIKECYFEVDLKGTFTYFNESLCKVTGYSRDELLGLNFKYITDEENRKKVFKGFNQVYKTSEPLADFEYQFKNKAGVKIIGETSVYLKYDSTGNKIGFYGIFRNVTERKEEEERFKQELEQLVNIRAQELRESEEKYSNLFHYSNDGIILHDLEGTIIDVNQRALEQFGYMKEEILGLKIPELHPISELESSKKAFEEIAKKGFVRFEICFKKKNGKIFFTEVSSSLFDMGGKQVIQGNIRDITDRVLTEKMLKESEEKYRNLIENAQEGVWAVDENDNTIFVNPKICGMLGYTRDEIMGKSLHSFLEAPMIELIISFRDRRKKGLKDTYELEFVKKDGTLLSTSINAAPILNENGEFKGSFAFVTDITNRKIAEQKLKESEERYRNLIESVPFSIALIDQQGKVIYCNPAIEKLVGYRRDELIGNEFKNLPVINAEYVPLLLKRFQKVLKGEILAPLEMELFKKDGDSVWVKYQSTLLKLGDQILLQTILNDITEQRKANLLIEEELVKLKELDQIRKDLISRVSHELKTPLVSVCGATELLLDLYIEEFKGDTKELLQIIEKGGIRLKHLVDNLVDITRIEYQKFELMKNVNDLNQVIRDCAKELMYLIKMRELNLELNLTDDIFLEFDKIRIEQVILNLLSNAIKNTPPNGKIFIKSLKRDQFVKLKITDTGIGLTKDEMDRLFTRFGKIERYGDGLEYIDIQGTGLGLYISKEIIDLHEGHIRVESEGRNKGSTFIVKLPII